MQGDHYLVYQLCRALFVRDIITPVIADNYVQFTPFESTLPRLKIKF